MLCIYLYGFAIGNKNLLRSVIHLLIHPPIQTLTQSLPHSVTPSLTHPHTYPPTTIPSFSHAIKSNICLTKAGFGMMSQWPNIIRYLHTISYFILILYFYNFSRNYFHIQKRSQHVALLSLVEHGLCFL